MSGDAQPPGHYRQSFLIDAFQMLDSNLSSLGEANERSRMLESEIQLFDDRFEQYCDDWRTKSMNELELTNLAIVGSANYKLFDEPIEPDTLPTYFRSIYAQQAEKRSYATNGILIDIDGPSPEVDTPTMNSQPKNDICDSLNGLTLDTHSPETSTTSPEVTAGGEPQSNPNSDTIANDSERTSEDDFSNALPPVSE